MFVCGYVLCLGVLVNSLRGINVGLSPKSLILVTCSLTAQNKVSQRSKTFCSLDIVDGETCLSPGINCKPKRGVMVNFKCKISDKKHTIYALCFE